MPTSWPDSPELDPERRLDQIQAQIRARIKQFDITALVDLLLALGYGLEMLEFRGNPTLTPHPTLLHDIEFPRRHGDIDEQPRVLITVNLGLLSCRSPLPSYFLRLVEDIETHYPVVDLLRTLDCSLLHTRLTSDRAARIVPEWEFTRRNLLRSIGLGSPVGLQWLCQQVFPELGVVVRRVDDTREVDIAGARLDGLCKLGECSFGKRTRVGIHELELVLICEDARYDQHRPWVHVGRQRLRDHVFPLLDEVCATLTVSFVLLDRQAQARISAAPPSYMGYDPMWNDDDEARLDPPARIQLYRGTLPSDEPDTDALERVLAERSPNERVGGQHAYVELASREPTPRTHFLGRQLSLCLEYRSPGRYYAYTATVEWGARAWYRDEPHTITLHCGDSNSDEGWIPKPPVTLASHPRMWALLRDEARRRLAERTISRLRGGGRVTSKLLAPLIDTNDFEAIYAVAAAPIEAWDEDAWTTFSSWRGR